MGDTELTLRPQRFNGKRSTLASKVEKAAPLEKVRPYAERIKYAREFLLELMEKYTSPLSDVAQKGLTEVIRSEESINEPQQQAPPSRPLPVQSAAKKDTKDVQENWHSGKRAGAEVPRQADTWDHKPVQDKNVPSSVSKAPQPSEFKHNAGKIQTAAELGRQAYRPGGSTEDRAYRAMVGTINKLTPENYERLSVQLINSIGDSKLLQQTLSFTFDNAVKQPSYCFMYAELCRDLERQLPKFVFGQAAQLQASPVKSMLLNTCQDELENALTSYELLSSALESAKIEEVTGNLRKRIIGIVRLICEIYKLDLLPDKVMFQLFMLLQSKDSRATRYIMEDTTEAVCEALSLTGYKLSRATRPQFQKAFKDVVTQLEIMAVDKNVSSRIRFCIQDVLELSRKNWASAKESSAVKKVSEISAQARAELGMVDTSKIIEALPALPAQQKQAQSSARDFNFAFPEYKGASSGNFTGRSALIGDIKDAPVPGAGAVSAPGISDEVLTRKAKNLYEEYCSTLDVAEAVTCFRELSASGGGVSRILEVGVQQLLDEVREREQAAIIALFVQLQEQGGASQVDILSAISTFIVELQDLSMDSPLAPKLLGKLYGSLVAADIFELDTLSELFGSADDAAADPDRSLDCLIKRDFCAAALKHLKASVGSEILNKMCLKMFHAGAILEANPELDGDLPSVADFLKAEDLECVPL